MRTIALLAQSCRVVVIGGYRGLSTPGSLGIKSSLRSAAAQLIYSVLCDGRLSSLLLVTWFVCSRFSKLSKQNEYLGEVQLSRASFAQK